MKFFSMIAAALLSIFSGADAGTPGGDRGRDANDTSDTSVRLKGTWIATAVIGDLPRAVLHFDEGRRVRFENYFGSSGSAEYRIDDGGGRKDEFIVRFEYKYTVERENGDRVENTERTELLFHVEDGRPILSYRMLECGGRGMVIMSEYLRKEDFTDGFRSKLSRKMNERPIPAMAMPPSE